MKVGLLSSEKYIGVCEDNLLLAKKYIEYGINVSEIAWDTLGMLSGYDYVIVRSTWGYQKRYEQYLETLSNLSQCCVLMNSFNIIKNNVYKEKQFEELSRQEIPFASTKIFDCKHTELGVDFVKSELTKEKKLVLKPNVSASGQDTILIDDHFSINEIKVYFMSQFAKNKKVIVQDYLYDVNKGEVSMIYILGCFSHSVLRFPGVIYNKNDTIEIDVSFSLISWCNKIMEKLNLLNELYTRIDVVITKQGPVVMEIELNEPDLFFRKIKNSEKAIDNFVAKSIDIYNKKKEGISDGTAYD